MSAQLIGTFEAGSPEWHAARAQGLGGSEIAAVLGLSKWESHYSLWLRKKGIIGDPKQTGPMGAGTRLEPVILAWWWEQHDGFRYTHDQGTYCHEDRPWQIANPDLIVGTDRVSQAAIVEAKFALYDYEWGEPGTDEIPPYYLAQCRWYLDVFSLDICYVPVFIGSQGEFREYIVKADADDQVYMRRAGEAFMASLAADERPSIDEHDATYEAVRAEHPDIDRDLEVSIPTGLWVEYESSKAAADVATAAHRKAKAEVLDAMGDARIATVADEPVLRRQPASGGVALHPVARKKAAA